MVVDGLYKKKKIAASTPLVVRIKSKTRKKRLDFLLLIKSTVSYTMVQIVSQKVLKITERSSEYHELP